MSVSKVWYEDFSIGLPLKNCVIQSMTFSLCSVQNFLKNFEVNPSGPGDFLVLGLGLGLERTSLTSSYSGVCDIHSFISLVIILGNMVGIFGWSKPFLVSY